ncbi:MAG: hypothetical protein JSV31_25445 [Desulfobacterales bacterium]|nr:MAG: hypothetical protein JSV31_25445 [Desulfobacterales bacterium]
MFRKRQHVFTSDNDGKEDKDLTIGQGIIDWNMFVKPFPRHHKGVLLAETYPKNESVDERAFLSEAHERLSDLGNQLPR